MTLLSPLQPLTRCPSADAAEFPVYALLKLTHCERKAAGRASSPPITARWLHGVIERSGRAGSGVAELHGVSSHFVRERLRNLNHGTFLQEVGPGLRNALIYAWTEVLGAATIHSYRQLHQLLGGDVLLAHDVARLEDAFGQRPFSVEEFLDLFQGLRDRLLHRQWYSLVGDASKGPGFTRFLLHRLADLKRHGLVVPNGASWRLTSRGEEASQWFELVIHSVEYPSPPLA